MEPPRRLRSEMPRNQAKAKTTITPTMSEGTVGRKISAGSTPRAAAVTGSSTEQLLLDALGDGEYSAESAAEAAGVSRATAQRRLASMARQGIVQVRLRYGATGRPEHFYSKPV